MIKSEKTLKNSKNPRNFSEKLKKFPRNPKNFSPSFARRLRGVRLSRTEGDFAKFSMTE